MNDINVRQRDNKTTTTTTTTTAQVYGPPATFNERPIPDQKNLTGTNNF